MGGGAEWHQTGNAIHALDINLSRLFLRSILISIKNAFVFIFIGFLRLVSTYLEFIPYFQR